MTTAKSNKPTRRDVVRGIGAAGLGAAVRHRSRRAPSRKTKKPINLSFWTFDNPQQRPWVHKRIKLFMEQNPNVKVDFQWFPFGDLGKKLSVGFATGTAPDGFVSQDWFMPVWLDKGLLAPLDVKKLGYPSYDAFTADYAKALSTARPRTARSTAIRCGSMATATISTPSSSRRSASTPTRTGRRAGSNSARSPSA